jgi:hypothetical protein
MANSTTIIADLKTVVTNGPKAATTSNANGPGGLSATGGAGNLTGGTGKWASGTYNAGIMDYLGMTNLAILKAQELANLVLAILILTDQATDGTNQTLLVNILNDLQ